MAGHVVLVTGVTRFIGSELAGRLARNPAVERVVGVDAALPDPAARARMGDAEFVRVDIRNPLISRVLESASVDTVVHASASAPPPSSAARALAKEMNVLGTMQLLAACQRSDTVRSLVVRSTSLVYGASSRNPAVFTEDTPARSVPSSGTGRDAVDIEAYVRGFSRRRPDVRVAMPRFADIIGPSIRTPLTRYFALTPVVPLVLGRNARLQLIHESDVVALLETLALGGFAGAVNAAGAGVLTVSQAIHRAGRVPLPVPGLGLGALSRVMQQLRVGGFSPAQVSQLAAGRVLDTTRMTRDVGFRPRFTTVAAFDDFAASLPPLLTPDLIRQAELGVAQTLRLPPAPLPPTGRHPVVAGTPVDATTSVNTGAPVSEATSVVATAPVDEATPVDGDLREPAAAPRPVRRHLVGIPGNAAVPPRPRRVR